MSKTALGALLLTLVLVVAAGAALGFGLPPVALEGASAADVVELHAQRSAFMLAWQGNVGTMMTIVATLFGLYAARNVPVPSSWRLPAPTSAQLALGVRTTHGPPPPGEAP